jgi:hypothetical protein
MSRGVRVYGLQGYLVHKKTPTSLGPPLDPRHRPTVGSQGGAFSYERGTPVEHLGCGVQNLLGSASADHQREEVLFPVQGLGGLRAQARIRAQGSGLKVWGAGCRVQGVGYVSGLSEHG